MELDELIEHLEGIRDEWPDLAEAEVILEGEGLTGDISAVDVDTYDGDHVVILRVGTFIVQDQT